MEMIPTFLEKATEVIPSMISKVMIRLNLEREFL